MRVVGYDPFDHHQFLTEERPVAGQPTYATKGTNLEENGE